MPSAELLARLRDLVRRDRGLTAELLAHIGEVEARRLHLEAACPSMFRYCTDILGMSGAQSYKRIGAARLARRFPQVLPMVKSGSVHLSTLCLLAPHLTDDSAGQLLPLVAGKSKREVEQLLAARFPSPAVPDKVRKLPWRGRRRGDGRTEHEPREGTQRPAHDDKSQRPVEVAPALPLAQPHAFETLQTANTARRDEQTDVRELSAPAPILSRAPRRSSIAPLSAEQFKVELTACARLVDKIRTAQDLLRHQVADGDLATVLERALDALLPALRKQRFAEVARPREGRRAGKAGARKNHQTPPGKKTAPRDRSPETVSTTVKLSDPPRTDSSASQNSEARSCATAPERSSSRSRHIPAAVKRQVARRDEYQCTFTDGTGRRCPERGMLEFHHIRPFGKGGQHDIENLTLRCRGHNHLASIQEYGERANAFAKATGWNAKEELPPGGAGMKPVRHGT